MTFGSAGAQDREQLLNLSKQATDQCHCYGNLIYRCRCLGRSFLAVLWQ